MNYKQTDVVGVAWTRCRAVTIVNPLKGKGAINPLNGQEQGPMAFFQEEEVLSIPNNIITTDKGAISKDYVPTDTIPLLDPATGNPTGESVTQAQLYQILYSLYIQTATARDNA